MCRIRIRNKEYVLTINVNLLFCQKSSFILCMKDFIRLKRKTLNILMSYKGNISGQIKLKLTALNENIQPKKKLCTPAD